MSGSRKAVVIGYATNDYIVELAEPFSGTGTTAIRRRPESGWPRSGGAALYASRQLALAGHQSAPITWIGKDADGERYQAACRETGVQLQGVAVLDQGQTATCLLMYQPNGDYGCLFDRGIGGTERLDDTQRKLIRSADLVLITIGPPALGNEVLENIAADAIVAWIAKDDDLNYPMNLRKRMASRADYIFCNSGERAFVDRSVEDRSGVRPTIIETRGSNGVIISGSEEPPLLPLESVHSPDATGAGDTLAGATMASVLSAEVSIEESVRRGIAAAGELLKSRILR